MCLDKGPQTMLLGYVREHPLDALCNYTELFREGLSDESVTSRRQDRTVVWVFIEILHIGAQQPYKIVIFRVSINKDTLDLPLIRPFFL